MKKKVKHKKIILYGFILMIFMFLNLSKVFTPLFVAVPTGSMTPSLKVGDLVYVQKVETSNIKIGDIIIADVPKDTQQKYNYPSSIIHRVVKIEPHNIYGNVYRTKGDNNKVEDPFTTFPENISGKILHKTRYLGFIVLFFHSKSGHLFLLFTFLSFLIADIYQVYLTNKQIIKNKIKNKIQSFLYQDIQNELKTIQNMLKHEDKKDIEIQQENIDKIRKKYNKKKKL